jgi:hypothetical protein
VRRLALGALLVLGLTGCRVDATTTVVVDEDGSGSVTVEVVLDEEAAARIPDLAEQLRVRDLERTGWTITGPDPGEGGGQVVTATKEFFEPDQLAAVLAEVGGVVDPSLERTRSFALTAYDFSGTLDLSEGLATFSDPQLTDLLDGMPVGIDPQELADELGSPLRDLTSFALEVQLPSSGGHETTRWEARLGDDPTALTASTEDRNLLALGLAAAAALAVVVLAVLLVVRLFRLLVHRRSGA